MSSPRSFLFFKFGITVCSSRAPLRLAATMNDFFYHIFYTLYSIHHNLKFLNFCNISNRYHRKCINDILKYLLKHRINTPPNYTQYILISFIMTNKINYIYELANEVPLSCEHDCSFSFLPSFLLLYLLDNCKLQNYYLILATSEKTPDIFCKVNKF